MDTPNYKESEITGTQWTRCNRVVIENPLNAAPYVTFIEEVAMQLGDGKVITQPAGGVMAIFDAENPKHLQAYELLNEIYMAAALARDAQNSLPE